MSEQALAALRISEDPTPGVNLVGLFQTGSGLGEASRMLARAIEHAGIPFAAITYAESPSHGREPGEWPNADAAPYDTNVLCLQPDRLYPFAAAVGPRFFADRTTVGLWFWESTTFPDHYRPPLRLLDRVWVTSEHVRSILSRATSVPVSVVPIPLSERRVEPSSRAALGLPEDGFLFLSLFDLVGARRKNPQGVVEAFRRAFEPGSGATLVLKTINGRDRKPRRLAELESSVADRQDITVIDGYVPAAERDAMIAACDCFVSLHRAEGLGLPILEAMVLGKPVIATGFSANVEFMDDTSGYLVPFELVPVPEGEWGYSPAAQWAEPDVEAAAAHMRCVFDDPESAREVGASARTTVLTRFSLDRAAATVTAELAAARAHFHERAGRRDSIADASLALARDPSRALHQGGGLKGYLRRLLVRALWPQLEAIYHRDEAMLEGLSELERSLSRLEARVADTDTP